MFQLCWLFLGSLTYFHLLFLLTALWINKYKSQILSAPYTAVKDEWWRRGGFSVDETVMDSLAFWFVCFRDPKLIIHVPVFLYCRQSPWQTTKTPFSEFPLGCNGTVLHHWWWLKVFRWLQLDGSTTAICLVEFHWRVSKLDFIGENLLVVLIKKVIITSKK